jgi:phthalate 4,5-dioxygenase
MLTREENELLTRTNPGTPGGEFIRRYWLPAALSEELPIGGPPIPVRLLGEDLALFRDDDGRPGLLGIHCAHRGADLSYGRLEAGGLRCIYHGWLYDIHGRCLEQPGEPAGSTFHEKIRQRAYPCVEMGGLILTYMGPGEPPLIPNYDFLTAPIEYRFATKVLRECNYLQGNEGNIDSEHSVFLHRRSPLPENRGELFTTLEPEVTSFGVRNYVVKKVGPDLVFARMHCFIMPNITLLGLGIDAENRGPRAHWHVPLDDTHHWEYVVSVGTRRPLD